MTEPRTTPTTRTSGAKRSTAPRKTAAAAAKTPTVAAADAKPHKQKLVRDSFTIPKTEYAVLDALKQRALKLERSVKKSELLRAGIAALNAMPDRAFLAALDAVPSLKTGRPKSASSAD